MTNIAHLERKERVFLAGSIRNMILSDGRIENEELNEIGKIERAYGFRDFSDCLEEFDREIETSDEYWEEAERIVDPEAQRTILRVLDEVSVRDGYRDANQDRLLHRLESLWSREE